MITRWALIGLASAFCLVCADGLFAQPRSGSVEAPSGFPPRTPRYRIQPSDVIEIIFRFTPEYNQVVTVQPDGFIPLHEVDEIKIAGLTVTEATVAILARYANVLNEPVVTVALKDFAKPFFVVGGEVARPGRFDLRGDVTLSDAIAMAGGFGLGAKTSEVLLFRRVSKEVAEVKKINIKNTLAKGLLEEDVILQPSDSIYVPKSRAGKVERFMSISRLGAYFPIPY